MELKTIFTDDDAVSPVIGVILMVAITVILAAVIASFVLGMGPGNNADQPQASFAFDYETTDSSNNEGMLTVRHQSGDSIEAQELYVRGSGVTDSIASGDLNVTTIGSWSQANEYADTSQISSGNRLYVGVDSDYEIDVVWEPIEGDTSATLGSDTGPDA